MQRESLSLLTEEKESYTNPNKGEKKAIEVSQEKPKKRKIQRTTMFHMQPHDILQKIVSKKSQKAIRLISHLQIGEYEDIELMPISGKRNPRFRP